MIDKNNAIFKRAVEILTDNNINYWVCHGTLLGIIRDNRLLTWDHDIDFAVWDDECSKEEILNIFAANEQFKQEVVLEEINSLHFATADKRVDINFYSRDTDKAYIKWAALPEGVFLKTYYFAINFIANDTSIKKTIESSNGNIIKLIKLLIITPLILVRFIFPKLFKNKLLKNLYKKLDSVGYSYPMVLMKCKVMTFLSMDIVVPVEPEEVLKFTYGEDWKTPKQNYVWYKEANNLFRQG
jgi:phosphorylcholine metabolism protein LicD